jgi:adenylyl-sulfate kinase
MADRRGFTLWFTGLSGAGKSTLARAVGDELRSRRHLVELLDGDEVRKHLSRGLGFSKDDRDTNIRRIGYFARVLSRNGVVTIAAAISPYRDVRDEIRREHEAPFVEIFVDCPLDELKGATPRALRRGAGEPPREFQRRVGPVEPPLAPRDHRPHRRETVEQSGPRSSAGSPAAACSTGSTGRDGNDRDDLDTLVPDRAGGPRARLRAQRPAVSDDAASRERGRAVADGARVPGDDDGRAEPADARPEDGISAQSATVLLAPWMAVFGVGLFQARLFNVTLGLGILLLVASIGRRVAGPISGLMAALLLALDSNFLGGVRNARTDIPSVFFVTAALAAYVTGRQRSSRFWFAVSGASLGIAMLVHGNAFWAGAILLAWYLMDYGRRALVVSFGYWFLGGLLLTFGPYLAVVVVRWADVRVQIGNFAGDRVPAWRPSVVLHQAMLELQRYKGWYIGLVTNAVPNPLLWGVSGRHDRRRGCAARAVGDACERSRG